MKYKKCILGIGAVYLCLFTASKCSARRIHKSLSFIVKLAQCVEDPSIDEVLKPGFFKENWELLNGGIRVNISNSSFLEIRKTEERVIIQLFGEVSTSKQEQVNLLRDNLNRQAVKCNTPAAFLNLSGIDLSKEPFSVYSILNINDADFKIIVQDILKGGDGSRINSLSEDVLKLVNDMGQDFEASFKYGLVDLVNLKLDKNSFIQALNSARDLAVERFRAIEDGKINIPEEERSRTIEQLVSLRDRIRIYPAILSGKNGDMIYRIFYRVYLIPFLENVIKGNNR